MEQKTEQNFHAPVGQVAGRDIHNKVTIQVVSRKLTQRRIAALQNRGVDAMRRVAVWALMAVTCFSLTGHYGVRPGHLSWAVGFLAASAISAMLAGWYGAQLPKQKK